MRWVRAFRCREGSAHTAETWGNEHAGEKWVGSVIYSFPWPPKEEQTNAAAGSIPDESEPPSQSRTNTTTSITKPSNGLMETCTPGSKAIAASRMRFTTRFCALGEILFAGSGHLPSDLKPYCWPRHLFGAAAMSEARRIGPVALWHSLAHKLGNNRLCEHPAKWFAMSQWRC